MERKTRLRNLLDEKIHESFYPESQIKSEKPRCKNPLQNQTEKQQALCNAETRIWLAFDWDNCNGVDKTPMLTGVLRSITPEPLIDPGFLAIALNFS